MPLLIISLRKHDSVTMYDGDASPQRRAISPTSGDSRGKCGFYSDAPIIISNFASLSAQYKAATGRLRRKDPQLRY